MRDATQWYEDSSEITRTSIHAPHAGCDQRIICFLKCIIILQFAHPMRDATAFFNNYLHSVIILLYICDNLFCSYAAYFLGFYREIVFIIFLLVRISLGRNEQWAFAPARDLYIDHFGSDSVQTVDRHIIVTVGRWQGYVFFYADLN